MLKRLMLLLCVLTVCNCTDAQVKKRIKRGRRNKSESQFMLDKNYFQAEWEVGHETMSSDLSTNVYPNLVVRYGVSKKLEVNAELNVVTAKVQSTKTNTSGIEPISLGINYLLFSETVKSPAIIFSGQFAVPFMATKNFTANYLAPTLEMIVEKAFGKKVVLAFSNGLFWDGFSTSPSYIYNAAASYNLSTKWTLTSEWFGFINGNPPQNNTDLSISYSINKSLQFGVTSGIGISSAAHKNYIAVNGVWGCHLKRNK